MKKQLIFTIGIYAIVGLLVLSNLKDQPPLVVFFGCFLICLLIVDVKLIIIDEKIAAVDRKRKQLKERFPKIDMSEFTVSPTGQILRKKSSGKETGNTQEMSDDLKRIIACYNYFVGIEDVETWIKEHPRKIKEKNMYKDKDGIEHKKYTDICFQDDAVICPCCGYTKNKYILNEIIEMFGLDIKCSKCGCVFLVMPKIKFEIRCRNYRTDGKEK